MTRNDRIKSLKGDINHKFRNLLSREVLCNRFMVDQQHYDSIVGNYIDFSIRYLPTYLPTYLPVNTSQFGAVVLAHLLERSVLTPVICSSNPVIGKFYLLSTVLKRQENRGLECLVDVVPQQSQPRFRSNSKHI